MEDHAIIELYWARDEAAISASDQKYGPMCRTLSRNILMSREDTEECVNDTWHRAWITMPPQRPQALGAYLSRICRNLSIDRWRSTKSQKRDCGGQVLLSELEECIPGAYATDGIAEAHEVAEALDRWLDTLALEDRALFLRRYWYGYPVAELARERGEPQNRTAQKLHRLREKLRMALTKEGIVV